MKLYQLAFIIISLFIFQSCIQDDFVDDMVEPNLRISTPLDTIQLNTDFQFEEMFLNNIGNEVAIEAIWSSSNPAAISITDDGLATANMEGTSTISVTYNDGTNEYQDAIIVTVGATTIINLQVSTGAIATTSSYELTGDFTFEETIEGVKLTFEDNYAASTALPGLYVYLSNNANSVGNAYEIGAVEVFNGAHEYIIPNVDFSDYQYVVYFCKPFNVKVGDGDL